MHRKLIVAIAAFAWLGLVPPVVAAPPTPAAYDCQTRMTQPRPAPPPPAGDENPWQCPAPQNQKLSSALHWFRTRWNIAASPPAFTMPLCAPPTARPCATVRSAGSCS